MTTISANLQATAASSSSLRLRAIVQANLAAVHSRIANAAVAAGRSPQSVELLAVSKTWPADHLLAAALAGQRAFGESYVQEATTKIAALADLARLPHLEWHFIGPLQSNKTQLVASSFAWVHSVDREKIAARLAAQRPVGMPPLQVCLQVNISGEASKSGVAPAQVGALARAVAAMPGLALRGLMAIPAPATSRDQARAPFARLRQLMAALNSEGMKLDTLSMGMSDDLEAAIAEGATIVRVGTAIFGEREVPV